MPWEIMPDIFSVHNVGKVLLRLDNQMIAHDLH